MTERRQTYRRRTCLNGRIEIGKLNGWALDCAVRNLSEGGARLAIPEGVVVPEHISLAISDRPCRPARLVWYGKGQAGFALLDQRGAEQRSFTGPCRRAPHAADVKPSDKLARRIAAITARRPASASFTCS